MCDLQVLNPFLREAFAETQKHFTSSIGDIGKISSFSNLSDYKGELLVINYVSNNYKSNRELWSLCRKKGGRIVSFDEMYAYLNVHMIGLKVSRNPSTLRKFFIKYNIPKCLIRCERSTLTTLLGDRCTIQKVRCEIDINNDGSIEIENSCDLLRNRFEIAHNNSESGYSLFLATESMTTCFNEPGDIQEVYTDNIKSLKANKHHNNFTILYNSSEKYNERSGSDSSRSNSSAIKATSFRDMVRSICEIILAQYNMRKNNLPGLFTENTLNTRVNYDKRCVDLSFRAAITRVHWFDTNDLLCVDSMGSFMELKHVSANLLVIGIGSNLLNRLGMHTDELEDMFLAGVSLPNKLNRARFKDDVCTFVKKFSESYISHVFERMRFVFNRALSDPFNFDDREMRVKSLFFRVELLITMCEFMKYEIANKIERLTSSDKVDIKTRSLMPKFASWVT